MLVRLMLMEEKGSFQDLKFFLPIRYVLNLIYFWIFLRMSQKQRI